MNTGMTLSKVVIVDDVTDDDWCDVLASLTSSGFMARLEVSACTISEEQEDSEGFDVGTNNKGDSRDWFDVDVFIQGLLVVDFVILVVVGKIEDKIVCVEIVWFTEDSIGKNMILLVVECIDVAVVVGEMVVEVDAVLVEVISATIALEVVTFVVWKSVFVVGEKVINSEVSMVVFVVVIVEGIVVAVVVDAAFSVLIIFIEVIVVVLVVSVIVLADRAVEVVVVEVIVVVVVAIFVVIVVIVVELVVTVILLVDRAVEVVVVVVVIFVEIVIVFDFVVVLLVEVVDVICVVAFIVAEPWLKEGLKAPAWIVSMSRNCLVGCLVELYTCELFLPSLVTGKILQKQTLWL